MRRLTEKSCSSTNLLLGLQSHMITGLTALTAPKVNTATAGVLHDWVSLKKNPKNRICQVRIILHAHQIV